MYALPNAAHGLHVVRSPHDPPPWRILKPRASKNTNTRPKGRRRARRARRTD